MSYWFLLALLTVYSSLGSITFNCDSEQCLNQQVEYQCTISGITLLWRIKNETNELGEIVYTQDEVNVSKSFCNAPNITTILLTNVSNLTSSISYTVYTGVNGYSIECGNISDSFKNCTIQVSDPPSSPLNLTVSSYTQSSVVLSWSPPSVSYQCVTSYTVNSNTTDTDITTTTTSVDLPLDGLSPTTTYCVSVAAVDTANRTGTYSDEECFVLHVPLQPNLMNQSLSLSDNSDVIRISWEFVEIDRPLVTTVHLSYTVNGGVTTIQISTIQNGNDYYDITNVSRDMIYLVTVFGESAVGNGSASDLTTIIYSNQILPTTPTTNTFDISMTTAFVVPSISPSIDEDDSESDTLIIISVTSVGILVAAVSIVIITGVIVYIWKKKTIQPEKAPDTCAQLEMTSKSSSMHSQASSKMSSKGGAAMVSTQSAPVEYSDVKHEVQYTAVDVGKSSKRLPPPEPTVNYSSPAFSGGKKY